MAPSDPALNIQLYWIIFAPSSYVLLRLRLHEIGCMIKIFFGGGGVVDGEGGSSERCLKWSGGGSLRDLSENILKQGVGKGKSCS